MAQIDKVPVAVITGAYGGMGSAIARKMHERGCHLAILGRDQARLDTLKEELNAKSAKTVQAFQTDLRDTASIDATFKSLETEYGQIDYYIHAAGIVVPGSLLALSDRKWTEAIETNLLGLITMVNRCAKLMVLQKQGHIVLINGVLSLQPDPDLLINSTLTGAVNNFAKAISKQLGPQGIRVNVLNPGATQTPLWSRLLGELAQSQNMERDALMRLIEQANPLGRIGSAHEIAQLVDFLCTEQATYLNGAFLTVDGGASVAF